jgi:DNA-binding transcriptional MerR regulator
MMKMRELEAKTGVNRETIRVFLRHGLIPEPSRPKHNVADYDERHVSAINAVRELQRNSPLTMKQIKEAMQGAQGGPRVDAVSFQHLEALVSTRVGIDVAPIRISALAKAYPDAASDAEKLAGIGIIEILKSRGGPSLSITDARLVTIWSEMRQIGFTEDMGFTPEMLTFYIEPAETVARNEATLFLERVQGRISEETAASMLQIALRQMADFWGLIRMKRFLAHIHAELDGQESIRPRKSAIRASSAPKRAK